MWSPARSARGRGDTACSQLCQPCPPCVGSSSLRAQARDSQAAGGLGQRRPVGPRSGPRGVRRRLGGAGREGARRPSPPGPGASNGGAAAPPARARRSLPAQPAALGPAPRPRGGPRRAGWAPSAALHREPPARACGLVGVT